MSRSQTRTLLGVLFIALGLSACDDGGGGGGASAGDEDAASSADAAGGGDGGGPLDDAAKPDAGPGGVLVVEPLEVEFGETGLDERSEQTLELRNEGGAALTVTAFEELAAPFEAAREPPINVPASASRTVLLRFTPREAGERSGRLKIVTDVPGAAPVEVALHGTGGLPEAVLETPVLDFGVLEPGTPGGDFIVLRNASETVPLRVDSADGVEPPFAVPAGQLPATVTPMDSARVLIQFQTEESGDYVQNVALRTTAGPFNVELRARVVAPGELVVTGIVPAWGAVDADAMVTVQGGPFARLPDAVRVGGVELVDLERVDSGRVRGRLPAGGEATGTLDDAVDVRVEIGEAFGLLPDGFIRTPPVADGQVLDAAALAAPIGPAGNPWHLAIDAVPAGLEMDVQSGAVILCDGRRLTATGVLRATGDAVPVVFSAESVEPGAWGGLRFAAAEMPSGLTNTIVELAGAGGEAAVETAQTANLVGLTVRSSAADGIRVTAGGGLILVGAALSDLGGDGVVIAASDASVVRLQGTVMRRVGWPVVAWPHQFPRPIGGGHDWAENAHDAVGLGGEITADAALGNQPAGVVFAVREPIRIAAGVTWSLGATAPLRLDGPIDVAGTLALPAGLRVQAARGGVVRVAAGGALRIEGAEDAPVVIEARDPGGDPVPGAWTGLRLADGAAFAASYVVVRDAGEPAIEALGTLGEVSGLTVEASAGAPLHLAGDAALDDLLLSGNARGVSVTGGAGHLAGVSDDPAPAVAFQPAELCADWDLAALLTSEGGAASSNCR